jgi:hypothetical protein
LRSGTAYRNLLAYGSLTGSLKALLRNSEIDQQAPDE